MKRIFLVPIALLVFLHATDSRESLAVTFVVSPIDGGSKARLTLKEWRVFWQTHGLANDQHSVLRQGMSVSYDAAAHDLTVVVPFDPRTVGSKSHKWMDRDFWNKPVPQDGHASPGPFQNLKQGKNVFHVWDGLPVLGRGDLPQ